MTLFYQKDFLRLEYAKKHQFSENLSFETCISSQEVMLGAPKLGGTLLGSMQRFWALFPWRWTLLKNNPQCPQNANKSRIFGHTGGYMSRRGTARDKKSFFSCPHRSHVFSKKRGHRYNHFLGKSIYNPDKSNLGGI